MGNLNASRDSHPFCYIDTVDLSGHSSICGEWGHSNGSLLLRVVPAPAEDRKHEEAPKKSSKYPSCHLCHLGNPPQLMSIWFFPYQNQFYSSRSSTMLMSSHVKTPTVMSSKWLQLTNFLDSIPNLWKQINQLLCFQVSSLSQNHTQPSNEIQNHTKPTKGRHWQTFRPSVVTSSRLSRTELQKSSRRLPVASQHEAIERPAITGNPNWAPSGAFGRTDGNWWWFRNIRKLKSASRLTIYKLVRRRISSKP